MTNIRKASELVQKCLDDWPYAAVRVVDIMSRLKKVKELLEEQEAKTGHWVSLIDGDTVAIDDDGCPERACYCSECQTYLVASDEYAVYGRYCPFCGAKMECR